MKIARVYRVSLGLLSSFAFSACADHQSPLAPSPKVAALPVATVTPGAGYLAWVTNAASSEVSVINTTTNTVVSTIPVGSFPMGIAITPDGSRAYVAIYGENSVSVINTATMAVTQTVPVGDRPMGVAMSPNGANVYVANYGGGVSVINTSTNSVTSISTPGVSDVAATPDGAYVLATNINGSVYGISTSLNAIAQTITTSGTGPMGVAVTPGGTRAYVANWMNNTVRVIDLTYVTFSDLPVVGGPRDVAITPDGSLALVTANSGNALVAIRTSDNVVAATIPVGTAPEGVAVTGDGGLAYVANSGSNNVTVIDALGNVVATVPVGTYPFGVAIMQAPPPVYPTATFGYPTSSVQTGSTFQLSLSSAQLSGNPTATFEYAFDCGDGNGYSALGSTTTANCVIANAGSTTVRGKVKVVNGEAAEYTGSVDVVAPPPPPPGPVFSSSCTYSVNKKGERSVVVTWANATPGVTLITVSNGTTSVQKQQGPTVSGSWNAKLASGTPTYQINGGTRRTDTSTSLVAAGAICTLQ